MITTDAEAFAAALVPMRPLLGLDLGTRTVGTAISDRLRNIATPGRTLKRTKFTPDAKALLAQAADTEACGIVLGLPLNMDGSEGPRAQSTRAFALGLSRLSELPILLWDERLSTVAAERALLEADLSRKRRAEVVDSVAAGLILQGALDRLAYLRD